MAWNWSNSTSGATSTPSMSSSRSRTTMTGPSSAPATTRSRSRWPGAGPTITSPSPGWRISRRCIWPAPSTSRFRRAATLEVMRLLSLINEQMLFGHFDLWEQEGAIMFRQSLLLAGGAEPTSQQVEVLLSSALEACECYFQSFQFVVWSGTSAKDALASVLFETTATPEPCMAAGRREEAGDQLRGFRQGRHPRRHDRRGRALPGSAQTGDQAEDRFRGPGSASRNLRRRSPNIIRPRRWSAARSSPSSTSRRARSASSCRKC